MLHALLATIGALAILASIVAKVIMLRGGAALRDAAALEDAQDHAVLPSLESSHVCRRRPGRVRTRSRVRRSIA